jgi:hypothetical protein
MTCSKMMFWPWIVTINDEKIARWLCTHPAGRKGSPVTIVVKSGHSFLSWIVVPHKPILMVDIDRKH